MIMVHFRYFNSTIVRLIEPVARIRLAIQKHFNSTIVRLIEKLILCKQKNYKISIQPLYD